MIQCSNCGKENASHYRFCLGCGAELAAEAPRDTGASRALNTGGNTSRGRQAALDAFATVNPSSGAPEGSLKEAIAAERQAEQASLASQAAHFGDFPPTPPPPGGESEALDPSIAALLGSGTPTPPVAVSDDAEIPPQAEESLDAEAEDESSAVSTGRAEGVARELSVAELSAPAPEEEEPIASLSVEVSGDEFPISSGVSEATQQPRICKKCQTIVPPSFSFCGACGARYEEESPAVATPSADPSPAPAKSPYTLSLTYIHPDGSPGQTISANEQQLDIGRESPWPIFQRDEFLSSRQAGFRFQDGQLLLEDLGGVNGVFLKLRQTHSLGHGDFFRAGQQLFRFERLRELRGALAADETRKIGSPLYGAWGRLVHVVGQGEAGQAWLLYEADVKLGRASGDIVFSNDRFMSSRHCGLRFQQDSVELYDQGSTNGTYRRLNQATELLEGDLILLGQQVFKVSFEVA